MKKLKILFQSRVDLFDQKGGDTVQILETKTALENLGVVVDISTELTPDVTAYDLVHIFNIDWVSEPYLQLKNAKKYNKPVVLSPIHHSLQEFEKYEQEYRYGLVRLGNFLLPFQPLRDVARNLVKAIVYPKKIKPALIQSFMGIRQQQKYVVENSDYVLVQTTLEASELKKDYNTLDFKWEKVINGVNTSRFLNPNMNFNKIVPFKNYIMSVGRIEPRKNQLSLIKAFKKLKEDDPKFSDFGLVFSGAYNKHHPTYVAKFRELVNSDDSIVHTGFVEQDILAGIMKEAKIYASPSWFETTGLVYLEAIVAGTKSILASGERSKEYLEDNAVYCEPDKIVSIMSGLNAALKPTVKPRYRENVIQTYTWEKCAQQTLDVYKSILS